VAGTSEKYENRRKKKGPDLFGFSQPAGLRVRPVPATLFQVFGPRGRGRSAGLDHRVPVVGRSGGIAADDPAAADGRGGHVASTAAAGALAQVRVGYDYGVGGGTIGSVAVGPPEQSQHNIRTVTRRDDVVTRIRRVRGRGNARETERVSLLINGRYARRGGPAGGRTGRESARRRPVPISVDALTGGNHAASTLRSAAV